MVGRAGWLAATKSPARRASVPTRTANRAALVQPEAGLQVFSTDGSHDSAASSAQESSSDVVVYQNGRVVYPVSRAKNSAGTLRLSPEIAAEYVVTRIEPEYPERARAQGIQGSVVLDTVVAQDGSVKTVSRVSGDPILAAAAIDAVERWRFQPFFRNGKPEDFSTRITLEFRIPSKP